MCGIAGFFSPSGFKQKEGELIAKQMGDQLAHRGPNDEGLWLDSDNGIALTHKRLSIMDLSLAGHQPMVSISGRYVLVYNGEVYNHHEIRNKIEQAGYRNWRGHSDTEVLLTAIELWGLKRTLKESVGMFALGLWDREQRSLSLGRDRMGEKPLYYGWQGRTLLFGSELSSLHIHPEFNAEINRDVLPIYFHHGYIPAPWSIWRGIQKLQPGTVVKFSAKQTGMMPDPVAYWSLIEVIQNGEKMPFEGSREEAIDALERQLSHAVTGQMMADVPLGVFLSGGIDSTTVTALMQSQSSCPVKTFTIGFDEADYNEAEYAKAIAKHLGTDHTELYLSALQAMDVIPKLAHIYSEPFGDSSAISTHLVSQLAKDHVTVSLSGDGGDELFGGYSRYFNNKAKLVWKIGKQIPHILRKPFLILCQRVAMLETEYSKNSFSRHMANLLQHKSIMRQLSLIANVFECESHSAFYRTMTNHWNPSPVINIVQNNLFYGYTEADIFSLNDSVLRMMAIDSYTYLPDDILVKVDRAAMAVGLETRIPLLDHRVVELAWSFPASMKVLNSQGKWLLKQVLYRYVPCELVNRRKMGFGVPVGQWLRGPLRDWAESLLNTSRLKDEGFLDSSVIEKRWSQHIKGHNDWKDSLWLALMWQAWLDDTTLT